MLYNEETIKTIHEPCFDYFTVYLSSPMLGDIPPACDAPPSLF